MLGHVYALNLPSRRFNQNIDWTLEHMFTVFFFLPRFRLLYAHCRAIGLPRVSKGHTNKRSTTVGMFPISKHLLATLYQPRLPEGDKSTFQIFNLQYGNMDKLHMDFCFLVADPPLFPPFFTAFRFLEQPLASQVTTFGLTLSSSSMADA